MPDFHDIKDLIASLYRERELLAELFQKRKSLAYKLEYALDLLGGDTDRLQGLINKGVLVQNGNYLEIGDQYLQFFEQVLAVNEEINTSYINESIQSIKENIVYYLGENNENRKYQYLRVVKNMLRKIGLISLRNVVDLKRNIDTTFKNEPNYRIKKAKLEHLDAKRQHIAQLILQTELLISSEESTFFKSALDEDLHHILLQLRQQLGKCSHNLIEIEKQIIDFLNQINHQSMVMEKLRQIKYLKDQFTLRSDTDLNQLLSINTTVLFDTRTAYPLKLGLDYLQGNQEAFEIIKKVAASNKTAVKLKMPLANTISKALLSTQEAEEVFINLEELKNGFLASGNHLFDYVMHYPFVTDITFDEKLTIYCQLISQYDHLFSFSDAVASTTTVEYSLVYPKNK